MALFDRKIALRSLPENADPRHYARAADFNALLDHTESWANVKSFGATGDGSADDTEAIQDAIDQYASGGPACVFLPSGQYKITSTIELKSHVYLVGQNSDNFGAGETGTEIAWYGADGGTAILTAVDDDTDWSRSGIERISVRNRAVGLTSGWGIKVRNPQNGSYLRDVRVMGFPTRQILAYEPVGRGSGAGTTPGYWFLENVFAIGGEIPVELQAGIEPTEIRSLKADTDATSTKGVFITKAPSATAQAAPITFVSSYIEIAATTGDVHGWEWDADAPISFIGCGCQRNNDLPSTKASFYYSGSARKWPTVRFVNCTSYRMARLFWFNSADLKPAAESRTVQQSFDFSPHGPSAPIVFSRGAISANLSDAPIYSQDAGADECGVPLHRPATGVSLVGRYSQAIVAGTVRVRFLLSGSEVGRVTMDSSHQTSTNDFILSDAIDGAWHHGGTGALVTMDVTTSSDLDPAGGRVIGVAGILYR